MARGTGGHSVSDITHHLKGIHFPASAKDVVQQARKNGAGKDILQALPEQDYATIAEVMKAVGEAERGADPEH